MERPDSFHWIVGPEREFANVCAELARTSAKAGEFKIRRQSPRNDSCHSESDGTYNVQYMYSVHVYVALVKSYEDNTETAFSN